MSHKIKKPKVIFLTVLVLCLTILTGGVIYAWKEGEIAKGSNKSPISLSKKSPPKKSTSISVSRAKIKKTSEPDFLLWKSESKFKNGSSFNEEFETKKENILKLLQEEGLCDPNFKSFWENWEQELKEDAWLVKEKRQEIDKFVYSRWYENDQGEKLKEMGSSKWW